jgi:hypothetical protein
MFIRRVLVSALTTTSLSASLLIACSGSTGEPNVDIVSERLPVPSTPDGEEIFTRTLVEFQEDGTQKVTRSEVTRSEQLLEKALREASRNGGSTGHDTILAALTHQMCSSQSASDIDLFDAAGETGNEICFYNGHAGVASADLSTYYRRDVCCLTADGGCTIVHDLWYGKDWSGLNCTQTGSTVNHVASIAAEGTSTPGGCFSTSGTTILYSSDSDFWNFCLQSSCNTVTEENTGTNVTNFRYLWLEVQGEYDDNTCGL